MLTIDFDSGVDHNSGLVVTAAIVTITEQNKGLIFTTSQNTGFESLANTEHVELLGLCNILPKILDVIDTMNISTRVCIIGDNMRTINLLNGTGNITEKDVSHDLRIINHVNMMLVNSGFNHIFYKHGSKKNHFGISVCDSICDWLKVAFINRGKCSVRNVKGRLRNKLTYNKRFGVDFEHFDDYEVHAF